MRLQSLALAGLILIASAAGASGQAAASTPMKIAYMNSRVIMERAPGAKEAAQQFDRYRQAIADSLEAMGSAVQKLMDEYSRQEIALSAQAKTQRQNEIVQRRQLYEQRVAQAEQQAAQRQKDLLQPIMDKVNQLIESMAKERGYAFVLDAAAGAIIYADETLDLTEEIIRRLQPTPGSQ